MLRVRPVQLLIVSLLLLLGGVGLTAPGAAAAPERLAPTEVPTTISVTATPAGPLSVHLTVAVTAADGVPAQGWVAITGEDTSYDGLQVSGAPVSVDRDVFHSGDHQLTFAYQPYYVGPGATYLPSTTTATVRVPGNPTTTTLSLSNEGVGVLSLEASVSDYTSSEGDSGSMVFEVEGMEPIEIPMGTYVVAGRLEVPNAGPWFATLDVPGLDRKGTYTATATFVPGVGSQSAGSTSDARTTTLSRTKDGAAVQIGLRSPRPSVVELSAVVYALFPANASGNLVVEDLDTHRRVLTIRSVALFPELVTRTLQHVSPGLHRYRATFVPDPGLTNLLGDSDVRKVNVRG